MPLRPPGRRLGSMKYPDLEILRFRDRFLAQVRDFFRSRDYIEVETPILNREGAVEAFLDPFSVLRTGKTTARAGYLITSPEYNLKKLAARNRVPIFEIAHCFRAHDSGGLHSEEFLMLEWYKPEAGLTEMQAETTALLQWLGRHFADGLDVEPREAEVEDLFRACTGRGISREELLATARDNRLGGDSDRYDELFFSVFLNLVEPEIRTAWPLYLKHYPPELAALSRIADGRAERFELYWRGIELCNAYCELPGRSANQERFDAANALRRETGRPLMEPDPEFLELSDVLGTLSGNALGLERLMMIYAGKENLADVSPFRPLL